MRLSKVLKFLLIWYTIKLYLYHIKEFYDPKDSIKAH